MADTNQIYTTGQNGIIIGNCNGTSSNKLSVKKREHDDPPDGGARAIVVMISAFLCNSILFGIINTYGTVYLTLQQNLESEGDAEASSKAGEFRFKQISKDRIEDIFIYQSVKVRNN